jgi:hypothetical protein
MLMENFLRYLQICRKRRISVQKLSVISKLRKILYNKPSWIWNSRERKLGMRGITLAERKPLFKISENNFRRRKKI